MHYREYGVGPPLDALVECIWFLRSDDRSVPAPQRVLPDGCTELIFHFDTPFAAGTDAGRIRQASSFLVRALSDRLKSSPRPDGALACAVGRLVRTAGRLTVAAVTRETGMSRRQLQRRFAERVGVSPKLLARVLRFQHTLRYRAQMRAAIRAPNGRAHVRDVRD